MGAVAGTAGLGVVGIPMIVAFTNDFSDSSAFSALISLSVGSMMYGLNRQLRAVQQL